MQLGQGQTDQSQAPAVRGLTHEPICLKETRVCWIELGAAIGCLFLGLILVLAGVSADNNTVSPPGAFGNKPTAIQVVIYIGIVLLIAGAVLLVIYSFHFYRVKFGQNLGPGRCRCRVPQRSRYPTTRQPQEPEEQPPPPPYYSRDPFPLLNQPTDQFKGRSQGRDFTRSEPREQLQSRNQSRDQPRDDSRANLQLEDQPRASGIVPRPVQR